MKNKLMIAFILIYATISWAGVLPTGYYSDAQDKSGNELKSALHSIIDDHDAQSYTPGVWNAYQTTDTKADGTIWDMYSDVPGGTPSYTYTYPSDKCGNYSGEGSCYNREHSFPKSWFSDTSPMNTDLFHVVPSDGYVNGKRGNYPYGEVATASWTSTNGSKLGSCSTDGYSGTVFEPIDEYKGDFARGYFYMATRYYGEDSSWPGSPMVDGAEPKAWALAMLKRWHMADPVSQKELDRNDAIFDIQKNRNPYIDHPEWVDSVWNGDVSTPPVDTVVVNPDTGISEIVMEASDYTIIINYVNAAGLDNSSTFDDSEYYYGASSHYTNYDIRDGKQNASFSTPEAAIAESIIKALLPAKSPNAKLDDKYSVTYATYDGSAATGTMTFHCSSIDPLTFVRDASTALKEENIVSCILYPNPATSSFALSVDASSVVVMNLSGQVLLSKVMVLAEEEIDLSNLDQGLYLVRIQADEKSLLLKLVKE